MLVINDITYRIGDRLILDRASAALPDTAKVGLIGRNGAGKTTLFRIVQGEVSTETGGITMPKGLRIGAVAQEAPAGPESLLDVVLAADRERAALMAEAESADGLRRAEIETRLADIGAHAAPARAAAILHGLGFDAQAQARPCSSFSGGWRMRVALAAVLFTEPDLLLLDEPTNYLDLEGTLWLYDYLERYPRMAIVISHDRDLLDTCCDHILHLDQGKLDLYRGNYSSFERQRAERRAVAAKARVKQDAERKHLQAFVDRFRAKASKARQAQSRLKRLEKLQPVEAIVESEVLPFHLPGAERPLSPPLIALEGAAAGYGDRAVLQRLNLSVLPDDRIALLGPNGQGKSTFCKLIAQRLEPMAGSMTSSSKLSVAYFAQHQLDELIPSQTPVAHVARLMADMPEARIRARAAQMGFPGQKGDTPVSSLSGGEKARLMLGLATFGGPHLLILDEPTNHLDIDSRAALMKAINDYPGAVILVSHDRFLIEACADRLWLVGEGTVKPYDGDLDDYRKLVLSGDRRAEDVRPAARPAAVAEAPAPRKESKAQLRRRQEELDRLIERLSGVIGKVDVALSDPQAFAREPAKAAELARMRTEAAEALARAEDEWLEVSERMSN